MRRTRGFSALSTLEDTGFHKALLLSDSAKLLWGRVFLYLVRGTLPAVRRAYDTLCSGITPAGTPGTPRDSGIKPRWASCEYQLYLPLALFRADLRARFLLQIIFKNGASRPYNIVPHGITMVEPLHAGRLPKGKW